jgi:dipeptidyl aminopeptidase/acylaminoacyl peptidase
MLSFFSPMLPVGDSSKQRCSLSTCPPWLAILAIISLVARYSLAESFPFTAVPSEFSTSDPSLRSPLVFEDGSPVQSAADWQRRREEILSIWHRHLGDWSPIIEHPEIEVLETTIRQGIVQRKVRVQLAVDQRIDGYFLLPPGTGPFPAVFVPFYDPETSIGLSEKPDRDFGWQLAQRGFACLAVGSPGGDARRPVLSRQARCQPLSYLANIAANGWQALASLPEVDDKRIGIVGHSYGGKWAMFGSCLWEKYACAVWSDPGIIFDESRTSINYQEPWYLGFDPAVTRPPGLVTESNPRTGAYKILVESHRNLHELHALMAPRPFLVSGGAEDPPKRWSVLQHTIAVNRLLGYEGRVAMTNRESHSPTTESNEQICTFLTYWLGQAGH